MTCTYAWWYFVWITVFQGIWLSPILPQDPCFRQKISPQGNCEGLLSGKYILPFTLHRLVSAQDDADQAIGTKGEPLQNYSAKPIYPIPGDGLCNIAILPLIQSMSPMSL